MASQPEQLHVFDEAFSAIMAMAAGFLLPAEGCTLSDLSGRVLAEDITSNDDSPLADNSAMDGYCFRHADISKATIQNPVVLPIEGHVDAGHPLKKLSPRHAAYIATGGLIPKGADTVVKIEDIEFPDGEKCVSVRAAPPVGTYVRLKGKDMKAGETVLNHGAQIGPFEVGMIAAIGRMGARARRKPRVAILTSGDELVMPFDEPLPWQVRNANTFMLASMVKEIGGDPIDLGIVRDSPEKAAQALNLASDLADIVITSGGVSMGRHDPFIAAFEALRVKTVVHGVAIKPGKPLFFGIVNDKPLFGLPGNQASTVVTFQLFARPFLARMQGNRQPDHPKIVLPIARASDNHSGRDNFLRGTISTDTVSRAEAFPKQDSHLLSSLAGSRILIRHPADKPRLEAMAPVTCLLIR